MQQELTDTEFSELKTNLFQELSENKAEMFNYFYENNEIF